MAADPAPVALPSGPISVEEVHRLLPTIRQSTLSRYDSCALSAYFDLEGGWGLGSPEAACGTIFHRTAQEAMKVMVATGNRIIPVAECLEIMYDVCRQRDVPPWDRVVMPNYMFPRLRLCVKKFANDNTFSIERVVGIEERLSAEIPYEMPDGTATTRTFTGALDLLMFDPPDGAIVLDYKSGWSLPPKPRLEDGEGQYFSSEEEAEHQLSFIGWFQQRAYALLVFYNYPSVQKVTLREFYVMRGQTRQATVYRADLEHIERELGILLEQLDRAIAAGPDHVGTGSPQDPWRAQPGEACRWCLRSQECPISPDIRRLKVIATREEAELAAAEFHVADAVRTRHRLALKAWTGENGPIPVKSSKGRKMIGMNVKPDGSQRFEVFTPEQSDKGMFPPDLPHTDPESDEKLAEAFAEAAAGVTAARPKRRRSGRRII